MATSEILIIHISTGTVAILFGFLALFLRKGSNHHRTAGKIFFGSMLIMSIASAYVAYNKQITISVIAGLFTFYLVASAWITVRRTSGQLGLLEHGGFVAALSISTAAIYFGLSAMNSESGSLDGYPGEYYLFFGGLALFAAGLDLNVIFRRGLTGKHRIARHLWRMCLAMFIATGSAFTGPGMTVFPDFVRNSEILTLPLLAVPENLVLILMVYWLLRVLFTKSWRKFSPSGTFNSGTFNS